MTTKQEKTKLVQLAKSFAGRKIAVFGDVMLDHFVRGSVGRISPEAPVPVVHVRQETHIPGGAGNVAANIAALGADVQLISLVGEDIASKILLDSLKERGIDVSLVVKDPHRPTTQKVRVVAEHQQVVRFDREHSHAPAAAVAAQCLANFSRALESCDAVILSDYGKGMLTNHNIAKVISLCRQHKTPVTVDPKVEHFRKYRHVTCITPNTKEAWEGMRLHPKEGQKHIEELGKKILRTLRSESVLVTQGPNGMTLFEQKANRAITHIPTAAREVYDVTGAGDTVISVLTMALACRAPLSRAALIANYAAGVVVAKLGTATVSREEIIQAVKQ